MEQYNNGIMEWWNKSLEQSVMYKTQLLNVKLSQFFSGMGATLNFVQITFMDISIVTWTSIDIRILKLEDLDLDLKKKKKYSKIFV